MKKITSTFLVWLPFAVAITGICALVYLTVQQNYRQSLNDPQIQMAEDAAYALAHGAKMETLVPQAKVDIARSLAPWIAIYDESGTRTLSSGELDGQIPKLPVGVFAYTKGMIGDPIDLRRIPLGEKRAGENRISWQPKLGVRQAIIVVWVSETKQFVIAGRSMHEVEARESALSFSVFVAWLVILITSLFTVALQKMFMR